METLKRFLQGHWLGHPLHPALIHIPSGLWPAAVIFDILSHLWWGDPAIANVFVRIAFWSILAGLVVVLLAAPTGVADWWEIKKQRPAHRIGLYHMILNVVASVVLLISLLMRTGDAMQAAATPAWPMAVAILAVLMVFVSGYLGGLMVFDHGVGIARQSKEKWREIAERGNARLPQEKA
jgi:uncharacterized membrane protein